MRPFQIYFPNEILLLIFIKGSELTFEEYYENYADDTEGPKHPRGPRTRSMKYFPALARKVCSLWRRLIDNYTSADFSFWTTTLELTYGVSEKRGKRGSDYPRRIAEFRRRLLASEGCDLDIFFHFRFTSLNTPENQMAIQLVFHTMDMLTPYQRQIARIESRCGSSDRDPSIYLLGLVTSCWMDLPRLWELYFRDNDPGHPNPLTYATRSTLIPSRSFETLQSNRAVSFSPPMKLCHLRNLNTLAITSGDRVVSTMRYGTLCGTVGPVATPPFGWCHVVTIHCGGIWRRRR